MFRLKEMRRECGLKRSKLAEDLQINAGTIANYENEIRQAPYEYLIKFADYFDVSIDYLLGRTDGEKPFKQSFGADELRLLSLYRSLDDKGRQRVTEYAEMWRDAKN